MRLPTPTLACKRPDPPASPPPSWVLSSRFFLDGITKHRPFTHTFFLTLWGAGGSQPAGLDEGPVDRPREDGGRRPSRSQSSPATIVADRGNPGRERRRPSRSQSSPATIVADRGNPGRERRRPSRSQSSPATIVADRGNPGRERHRPSRSQPSPADAFMLPAGGKSCYTLVVQCLPIGSPPRGKTPFTGSGLEGFYECQPTRKKSSDGWNESHRSR